MRKAINNIFSIIIKFILVHMISLFFVQAYGQTSIDTLSKLQQLPASYISSVEQQSKKLNQQLDHSIQKQLHILYKAETKLLKHLQKTDSSKTNLQIPDYQTYINNIQQKAKILTSSTNLNNYIPQLDSLSTSLKFLNINSLTDQTKTLTDKLNINSLTDKLNTTNALQSVTELQNKLNYSNAIEQVLKEKQQQYKDILSKYTDIPTRFKKSLNNYTEKIYYYKQQIQEYKDQLKDPEKLQQKAMSLLRELPAFQNFMKKNSFLASIFRTDNPTDINDPSLAGLQRRTTVETQIQNQISNGGPNAQNIIQTNLQQAKQELDKLKDKIAQQGNAADLDMPNFKPNTQKTKTFWKRLEYGANLQNQKGSSILPNMSDIALTVGYKLNDKSVIGIGTSYKLGLGTGLDHIKLSNEGISLRSYIDYKIKNSWYMSGGYEQNYLTRFSSVQELNNINAWQQSGLLGISKIQKLGKKYKAKIQLLYDLLYQQQAIKTSPVKFRLGYVF